MVLADRLSLFPCQKYNALIELHQNIQCMHFNSGHLNIMRGAIERRPVHGIVYRLTLNGWPDRMRDVPHVVPEMNSL